MRRLIPLLAFFSFSLSAAEKNRLPISQYFTTPASNGETFCEPNDGPCFVATGIDRTYQRGEFPDPNGAINRLYVGEVLAELEGAKPKTESTFEVYAKVEWDWSKRRRLKLRVGRPPMIVHGQVSIGPDQQLQFVLLDDSQLVGRTGQTLSPKWRQLLGLSRQSDAAAVRRAFKAWMELTLTATLAPTLRYSWLYVCHWSDPSDL